MIINSANFLCSYNHRTPKEIFLSLSYRFHQPLLVMDMFTGSTVNAFYGLPQKQKLAEIQTRGL